MKTLRHGDLNFIEVTKLSNNLEKKDFKESFILAEGETTGHYHKVKAKTGKVEIYQDTFGTTYIKVDGVGILTHPEHKTIEMPAGIYKMKHEQEYDWFALETRRVID